MQTFEPVLALGFMSGTSADGVDAALIRTDGTSVIEFVESLTCDYEDAFRSTLVQAASESVSLDDVITLERQLTDLHVQAGQRLLAKANVTSDQLAIAGFHGHTLRHDTVHHSTCQIGDPSWLGTRLGCAVVSDFRSADIAAGGQGAPLAPLFHQALLQHVPKPAVVLNLGGVGNVTWIGADGTLMAGDTGPGCGLLDQWAQEHLELPFDEDGKCASAGTANAELADQILKHEFFRRPFPKSADRYQFRFVDVRHLSPADGAATLCSITAGAVAQCLADLPELPKTTWVTGGGAQHPVLMENLRQAIGDVRPVEDAGLRGASLEAECFAWLAVRRLRQLPTSLPSTTGCAQPTCGGSISLPAQGMA